MALIEFHSNPSDRQLKQFGAVCVIALPLIVWLWSRNTSAAAWAAGIGAVLCVAGLVSPKLLKPVFIGLSVVTIPIGLVVGELAMLLIWFGLFLPMAVLFRILGRDALQRRSAGESETFWQKRHPPSDVGKYYQQS